MGKRNIKTARDSRRLRFAVDCSHDPDLYERIAKAAQRNFNTPTVTRGMLGKFTLKVLRWYLDQRGDDVTNGL